MEDKGLKIFNRLEKMPVPLLPTMVGAITLANYMQGLGFEWVRHVTVWAAIAIWLCYVGKIILFPKTCKGEYDKTIIRSLYAGFTMIMMGVSGYLLPYAPAFAKVLWLTAIVIHACHILYFTYRSVIKEFSWDTFMPSWFVTYNGIMVATVVGGGMNEPLIGKIIVYYGITVYCLIIPFMVYRLVTKKINVNFYHTQAIVLAPCSLCLVSYVNFIEKKNIYLLGFLYTCVLLSLAFIIIRLPKFFSLAFTPGYAGMTFPMAIGTVASAKMSGVLAAMGYTKLSGVITEIAGFQFYLTTMIVGYVLLQFVMKWIAVKAPEAATQA